MTNIPQGAEYYYQDTYYKLGVMYAMYFSGGSWMQGALVSNEELVLNGVKLSE